MIANIAITTMRTTKKRYKSFSPRIQIVDVKYQVADANNSVSICGTASTNSRV